METIVITLEVVAGLLLARGAIGHVCADAMHRRWTRPGPRPPLSVPVAVEDGHERLYEHLVALVCQRYPSFELVLAANPGGATDDVVRRVRREFPAVVRLVAPAGRLWLSTLYAAARHDDVVIVGDGSLVGPHFLADLADGLVDRRVSIVQGLVVRRGRNLALGEAFRALEVFPRACIHTLLRDRGLPRDGPLLVRRPSSAASSGVGDRRGRVGFALHVAPPRRGPMGPTFASEYARWNEAAPAATPLSFVREPPGAAWLAAVALLVLTRGSAWPAALSIVVVQAALHASLWRRIHGRWPPLLLVLALPACECIALLTGRRYIRGR